MIYDVIIAGAGPAGSILAKYIARDKKVLLIDKRSMSADPKDRMRTEKCCGGLLDPSAQDALTMLHIAVPKSVLEDPQVFAVRAIDFDNHSERYYPKRYVNIDRTAFDRFLLSRATAEENVEFREECLLQNFTQSDGYVEARVLNKKTGHVEKIHARYLVGADGAASIVKTRLSERYLVPVSGDLLSGAPRAYTCLQEYYTISPEQQIPYHAAIFDRQVTDFYSWLIPKSDKLILGTAIPEGENVKLRFAKLKAELIEKGFPLTGPAERNGCRLLRPRPFGSVLSGKGRVFLCGEAAGLISPSSAEGISYAIRSAVVLGKILKDTSGSKQARYDKGLGPLKREIAMKSLKSPIMYGRLARGAVFQTRLLSIKTEE